MKGGSLHTRSFKRIHFSVFRYRWFKNGFTGPKTFRGFRETGPSPVSRDPGIAVPGSRLAGLTFFHVIAFAGPARLIKPIRAQNQARSGFPRFIASAINRAGSPHIIPAESDLGTPKQPGYPGQPGSCNQALSSRKHAEMKNLLNTANLVA